MKKESILNLKTRTEWRYWLQLNIQYCFVYLLFQTFQDGVGRLKELSHNKILVYVQAGR